MTLEDLKKKYEPLAKKYNLPGFKVLNEDFEIDKIEKDTDIALRAVRKMMMEKIINSMSFLEMLLNPINTPRLYFLYLKSMTSEDKKDIEDMYGVLAELSIDSLQLEINYSEKLEAELIKDTYEKWNSLKTKFKKILANIKNPSVSARKEKTYFG